MNRRIAACLCILFLGMPITGHAAPILPAPHNEVSVSASGGAVGIISDSCGGPTVFGSAPVSNVCQAGGASSAFEGDSSASAGMGVVHISTLARANTLAGATYGASANASATMQDFFAISGPANSTGHLSGSIVIAGSLDVSLAGAPLSGTAAGSSYNVDTSFGSRSGNYSAATNGFLSQSNIAGGVLPVGVDIFFGPDGWAPITLSINAGVGSDGAASAYQECSSCALINGAFSTAAAFGSTIYWGGISGLTVDGVPLTDFLVVSASGADYRYATDVTGPAPVPEPGSIFLLLSGLAAIGMRFRAAQKIR